MRRIAGVPGPVLVATLGGLFVGPDTVAILIGKKLDRRAAVPVIDVWPEIDGLPKDPHHLQAGEVAEGKNASGGSAPSSFAQKRAPERLAIS